MKTFQDLVKKIDFSEVSKYLAKEEKTKCEDIFYRVFLGLPRVGEGVIYPIYNRKRDKLEFIFCFVTEYNESEDSEIDCKPKKIDINKEKNIPIILGSNIDYKYLKNTKYSDITEPELLAELLKTILRR